MYITIKVCVGGVGEVFSKYHFYDSLPFTIIIFMSSVIIDLELVRFIYSGNITNCSRLALMNMP